MEKRAPLSSPEVIPLLAGQSMPNQTVSLASYYELQSQQQQWRPSYITWGGKTISLCLLILVYPYERIYVF